MFHARLPTAKASVVWGNDNIYILGDRSFGRRQEVSLALIMAKID